MASGGTRPFIYENPHYSAARGETLDAGVLSSMLMNGASVKLCSEATVCSPCIKPHCETAQSPLRTCCQQCLPHCPLRSRPHPLSISRKEHASVSIQLHDPAGGLYALFYLHYLHYELSYTLPRSRSRSTRSRPFLQFYRTSQSITTQRHMRYFPFLRYWPSPS